MKKFLSKCWKDIIYITLIIGLIACVIFQFVSMHNYQTREVWGIVLETHSGVVKEYNIETWDGYQKYAEQNGMLPAGNLLREIKISEPKYSGRGENIKTYTVTFIEWDDDITTTEYSWEQILHIEYK